MESIKDESRTLGIKLVGNDAAEALLELGKALTKTGEELMASGDQWKLTKGGLKQFRENAPCICPPEGYRMSHSTECLKAIEEFETERVYFWLQLKTGDSSNSEGEE